MAAQKIIIEICHPRHARNFAHCWIDFSFSLYGFCREQNIDFDNVKLRIYKKPKEMPILHKACYKAIFKNYEIVPVKSKTHPLDREDIRIIRPDGTVTTKNAFFKQYLCYKPDYVAAVKSYFCLPESRPSPRRCIIPNSGTRRRLLNQQQLISALRQFGLEVEVVNFHKLSIREQLKLVDTASYFIGIHGAAFAHTLFSERTQFFELMPYGFEWDHFHALGNSFPRQHNFFWNVYRTENKFKHKYLEKVIDTSRAFILSDRPRLKGKYKNDTKEQWLHRYHRDASFRVNILDFIEYFRERSSNTC